MIDSIATALANKTVFVTGHTGFKGAWLSLWLARLGARVVGYSLAPPTSPSLFAAAGVRDVLHDHHEADIRDVAALESALAAARPELILHLAAQPLVRAGYADPVATFDINVRGTINVLDVVRRHQLRCGVVCVTTDKCYENREHVWGYREDDALGGYDPYSASKAAAEIAASSYRRSYFSPDRLNEHGTSIASVRAGNVIGGGDWAADRIVTELVRAAAAREHAELRNPAAVRPWQHVLEPLSGYLTLAARIVAEPDAKWCEAWNFGPQPGDELTVGELADVFSTAWGGCGRRDVGTPSQPHEAGVLKLCIDKAIGKLGWRPRWRVDEAVRRTARWYREYHADRRNAQRECLRDIVDFERATTSAVTESDAATSLKLFAVAA